jgi:HSP20 family protein
MTLAPFRQLRDFVSLREAMGQLFEESLIPTLLREEGRPEFFSADLYEKDDVFVIKASLPGLKAEEVKIDATANGVTISGEYKRDEEVKKESYLRRERRYGTFYRSFTLPVDIDAAKVEASFENGVLTVKLPKGELAKPKHIAVKAVAAK